MKVLTTALLSLSVLVTTHVNAASALSAAVLPCSSSPLSIKSIQGDIATAVVRSLLGTAIDAAVKYLDDDRAASFEVIVPTNSLSELTTNQGTAKCFYVSSDSLDSSKLNGAEPKPRPETAFFAKIKLIPDTGAAGVVRPEILDWRYQAFLEPSCPVLRNCDRRDVVVSMSILAPAATVAGRTIESEPIGFSIENATPSELTAAVPASPTGGASLPWFLAGDSKGPRNIVFKLIETSRPNAFTKALGAALAAQKTVILDTVDNRLKGIAEQVAATAAQKDVAAAAAALDDYKKAHDAALATAAAFAASTDSGQKVVLKANYQVQRAAANLARTLAKAAFDIAGISFPADGFGPLGDL